MLEIAALAATVVSKFLVPLLTKSRDKLEDDLSEAGAKAAAGGLVKTAESLWDRIKKRFDRDDEKNAVALFEQHPEDMKAMLSKLLEQRLSEDPEFHKQLSDLAEAPVAGTGQTAWQLMGEYVGGVDARGATISGNATVAGVVVGAPPPRPPNLPPPPPPPPPKGREGIDQ
jgi:hypothetical protein